MTARWKHVVVRTDSTTIQGGYNDRREPVDSVTYQLDGTTHHFVELSKCAKWFVKAVGGRKTVKGDLKAVTVVSMIRDKFNADSCDGGCPPVDAAVAVNPATDPMDAMDDLSTPVTVTPTKKPPKPKRPDPLRPYVRYITVPLKPPYAGDSVGATTVVCVYQRSTTNKRSQGCIYLRVDSIPWVLEYAAAELKCQGVATFDPAPVPITSGNCSAVAGLRLEYDFGKKAWDGTFVDGPRQGVTAHMLIADLGNAVWQKLKDTSLVDGWLCRASMLTRKAAVKDFVLLWCDAITHDVAKPFETLLRKDRKRLENAAGATPQSRTAATTSLSQQMMNTNTAMPTSTMPQ